MQKIIFITGASSGVGEALVHFFANKDYEVIAAARRHEKLKTLFSKYDNVKSYYLDLNSIENTKIVSNKINKDYPYIPYLINNAGINIPTEIANIDEENLLQSMYVNAFNPLLLTKNILPKMVQHNFGRIINITSGAPLNCFPKFGLYSASKAALNAFTVTMAKEYDKYNIKINLMSPGPIKTEMVPDGPMEPSVCFPTIDYLTEIDESGPTGKFFWLGYDVPLFPDLEGVNWLEGIGNEKLTKVI